MAEVPSNPATAWVLFPQTRVPPKPSGNKALAHANGKDLSSALRNMRIKGRTMSESSPPPRYLAENKSYQIGTPHSYVAIGRLQTASRIAGS